MTTIHTGINDAKIVILGNSGVGKTQIANKYTSNRFDQYNSATIGCDLQSKICHVNNKLINLQLHDTSGSEKFRSLTKSYYRGALGAILVYDICDRNSFEELDSWYKDLLDNAGSPSLKIILIGNKLDLADSKTDNFRQVSKDDGEKYARYHNWPFFEASAKSSKNIHNAFETLAMEIVNEITTKQQIQLSKRFLSKNDNIDLAKNNSKINTTCC